MLFSADIPRTPSADNLTSYFSNDTLDFYLDFPIPDNGEEYPYLMMKYSHEITFHTPIIQVGENNTRNSDYGTKRIYKSGKGEGGWSGRNNEGFLSGDLKEKSKIEYLKPEGETGETNYDLWFVGYENFFHNKYKSMNQPEI